MNQRSTALVAACAFFYAAEASPAVEATLTDDVSVSTAAGGRVAHWAAKTLILSETSTVFLRFDVAGSLPSDVTADNIGKATLKIWLSHVFNKETSACVVRPVLSSWREGDLFTHFLPILGSGIAYGEALVAKRYLTFDVTDTVKTWVRGQPYGNGGFAIQGTNMFGFPTPTRPPLKAWVDSKENTATGHHPTLDITLKGY